MVVKLSSEQIKGGPEYDQSRPIDREYEEAVHQYYSLPHYWKYERSREIQPFSPARHAGSPLPEHGFQPMGEADPLPGDEVAPRRFRGFQLISWLPGPSSLVEFFRQHPVKEIHFIVVFTQWLRIFYRRPH